MKRYEIQFAFNKATQMAGEHIGKVAVREQAMKIASAYAQKNGRNVDVFEIDTDFNKVTNRWRAFSNGGIWSN